MFKMFIDSIQPRSRVILHQLEMANKLVPMSITRTRPILTRNFRTDWVWVWEFPTFSIGCEDVYIRLVPIPVLR